MGRKVVDGEFARRLHSACDNNPAVPPPFQGRQVWIREQLEKRFKLVVSGETVSKWFAGAVLPRRDKMGQLAEVLGVDPAWLAMGSDPGGSPRERRVRGTMTEGAVNLVAGFIQLDGWQPAFSASEEAPVDLHAIIKGAHYSIHVALGEVSGESVTFQIPRDLRDVLVLGVVRTEGFSVDIAEIPEELIAQAAARRGSVEVTMDLSDFADRRIESFKDRL